VTPFAAAAGCARSRFPTHIQSAASGRVGAGFAQNWRSARRSFTPWRVRFKADQLARIGTIVLLRRPAALAGCLLFHISPT